MFSWAQRTRRPAARIRSSLESCRQGVTTKDLLSCARRSISFSNVLSWSVCGRASSVSPLAYPKMVPWSPAPTSRSSLPTCTPPAMSGLCLLMRTHQYLAGLMIQPVNAAQVVDERVESDVLDCASLAKLLCEMESLAQGTYRVTAACRSVSWQQCTFSAQKMSSISTSPCFHGTPWPHIDVKY